jgi:uncharacterized protein (DUF1330 family)
MKYYAVAEIDVANRGWVAAYVKNVTGMVEQHGGRYLARTSQIEKLEGERRKPQFMVIIEWPSKEVAEAFYNSDDYKPYLQMRKEGARNEFLLVAGEDINQTAKIAR